jgi:hypothetical protein
MYSVTTFLLLQMRAAQSQQFLGALCLLINDEKQVGLPNVTREVPLIN